MVTDGDTIAESKSGNHFGANRKKLVETSRSDCEIEYARTGKLKREKKDKNI